MRPSRRGGACRPVFFAAALLLGAPLFAAGEAGQPGGYLRAGAGGRALALGNAYAALAEGAEGALWNPAGLGGLRRASFESSVSVLSLSRRLSDANLALSFSKDGYGWGSFSASWIHFSLGNDFEGRSSDSAGFYSFADQQNAFVLAHGRKLTEWLHYGGGMKIYERRLDQFHASGLGADLGLLLVPVEGLRLGVAASDAWSRLRWNTGYEEAFPLMLRIGLAGELLSRKLMATGQVSSVEGRQPSYHLGLEGRIASLANLRAGIFEQGFTLGGGIRVAVLNALVSADYAFAPDPLDQGSTQRFSLSIEF